MVMYTKKYPRLSEGYHDRHTYEKDSRYSTSRHNPIERRDYEKSPSHYSSPRYVHKSSHSDRNKEKHDRDHAADGGSDRKLTGKPYKASKHAEEDVPCHTLEPNNSCRSDSSELKYEKRDGTDTGSDDQDHKDEVLKTAVRVCGLWSEHISSSGKRYYYNCETEVSQWEKPKEWTTDTPKSVDGRRQDEERKVEGKDDRQKLHVNNGGLEKFNDSPRDTMLVNGEKQEVTACQGAAIFSRHSKKMEALPCESAACSEAVTVTPAKSKLSATTLAVVADRSNSVSEHKNRPQPMEQESPAISATPELRASRESQQGEDMEISPGNSPKRLQLVHCPQEVANVRNGHKKLPIPLASPCSSSPAIDTAQLIKQLGDKTLQTIDRNAMIGQALQTLQKLHEVILSRQGLTATQQSPRSTCSESPFLPSKSPQTAPVWPAPVTPLVVPDEASRPSNESPRSDSGSGNRTLRKDTAAVSPALPLPVSSAGMPLPTSLAQAASKLQPHAPQLLPTHLSNHFDERLLMHVAGWPADHLEKQTRRYTEEAHTLGSLHCTKVSVDLKKARSLLRIAEIRSTLQEHRNLFLQHRILELENANTHFATQ